MDYMCVCARVRIIIFILCEIALGAMQITAQWHLIDTEYNEARSKDNYLSDKRLYTDDNQTSLRARAHCRTTFTHQKCNYWDVSARAALCVVIQTTEELCIYIIILQNGTFVDIETTYYYFNCEKGLQIYKICIFRPIKFVADCAKGSSLCLILRGW